MKKLVLISMILTTLMGCVMMSRSRYAEEKDLARLRGRLEIVQEQVSLAEKARADQCFSERAVLEREIKKRAEMALFLCKPQFKESVDIEENGCKK